MAPIAVVSFVVAPEHVETLKYGPLARACMAATRAWARRHGYHVLDEAPDLRGRAPCWGKLPVLLAALERHDWALWVDADAAPAADAPGLDPWLDPDADLIVQAPEAWFRRIGLDPARGRRWQPVNTGVFAVRASGQARDLLQAADALGAPHPPGARWNGIGDQEAIATALARGAAARICESDALQRPPGGPGAGFTHYFGDHAAHRYPAETCRLIVDRLAPRIAELSPDEAALLHWCAIQNLSPETPLHRGGPERFGYAPADLDRSLARVLAEA